MTPVTQWLIALTFYTLIMLLATQWEANRERVKYETTMGPPVNPYWYLEGEE